MAPNFHIMANFMTFNIQTFILCDASTWFGVMAFLVRGFVITLIGHTKLGRTPLDQWSAWLTDLYRQMNNILNTQIPTFSVGFEPAFPAGERPQTHATGISVLSTSYLYSQISRDLHYFRQLITRMALVLFPPHVSQFPPTILLPDVVTKIAVL
jgi:hypothetical protein